MVVTADRVDECEIRARGQWLRVDITYALKLGKNIEMRCPECHGRVRAHKLGTTGQRPHFEHRLPTTKRNLRMLCCNEPANLRYMTTNEDAPRRSAGWAKSLKYFVGAGRDAWLEELRTFHQQCMGENASAEQCKAWEEEFGVLQVELATLLERKPESGNWSVIFEFELPRERGRRPDVVLLAGAQIVVLEFKGHTKPGQAFIDQAAAYARDVAHYHEPSHGRVVNACLVLTRLEQPTDEQDGVVVLGPGSIAEYLAELPSTAGTAIVLSEWLSGEYAPLPSLISAARTIFQHHELPRIRRADSAGIPAAIAELNEIAQKARTAGERHLVLVTGVPGAGKTLLGLQFVYDDHFGQGHESKGAVMLSGNGPLVKVLQHALQSRAFVGDVHGFLKQYGGKSQSKPKERIFVYDEAQRAWDAERVQQKRGHDASEPKDFVGIGNRLPDWCVMVGLIGEGQEIHLGEEAGIGQWADALAASNKHWIVHCPQKLALIFQQQNVVLSERLDLTTSLRSHLAADVHKWVALLLQGDLPQAAVVGKRLRADGFDLYLTQDVERARQYVQDRYSGQIEKRFGQVGSSKAVVLRDYGFRTDFAFSRNFREGPWFNNAPTTPDSCCQLRETATEFACQGLELDFPIVGWGDDLLFDGASWKAKPSPRSKARDPEQLRRNSYRVLLTRGRDGMVIFVPPVHALSKSLEALHQAGCQVLPA